MSTLEVGNTTIDYEVRGDGDDVVLVHGITESRSSWGTLIDVLAADHRVIAIDLRGHGASSKADTYDLASMAGDLGAVLAAVGATDPLLIGHSLGGVVVSAYAANGGPCRGVVNVDQPLLLGGFKDGLTELEPMLRGAEEEFRAAIAGIFDSMLGSLGAEERARLDGVRRPEQDVVLGIWELVLSSDAADLDAIVAGVASGLTVPYFALHGIDPGAEYETWLQQAVPSSVFEVWPDVGHYPHLVQPVRFIERVREFDASLSA